MEGARRKSIHRKIGRPPHLPDHADVRFGDVGSTCLFVRSLAIVKITGACKLAETGRPTSTLREITSPSTGDVIVQ